MFSSSIRRSFLYAQRRRGETLEQRVAESLPELSAEDRRYGQSAREELARPGRPVAPEELRDALRQGRDAFVGEYHMLAPSLGAAARLLEWRLEGRDHPILALGILREGEEALYEDWARGNLGLQAFEFALAKHWPAAVSPWRPLFRLARRFDLDCVGIRPHAAVSPQQRLAETARILARATHRGKRGVFVVDGDFHCVPCHLPTAYGALCSQGKEALSIGQNEAGLAWGFLEGEGASLPPLLKQAPSVYHLYSAHPLRKLEAHLAWMEDMDELSPAPLSPWRPKRVHISSLQVAIRRLLRQLKELSGLAELSLQREELTILGVEDVSRLEEAVSRGRLPEEALPSLWQQVEGGGSWFLPGDKALVYLADLRVDHVAEELVHWIHGQVDPTMAQSRTEGLDEFYEHVAREALAFLVTRRLRPDRPAPNAGELLEASRSSNLREVEEARLTLSFLLEGEMEPETWFQTFRQREEGLRVACIHMIGYGLGAALDENPARVSPREISEWLRLPMGREGVARLWYEEMRRVLSRRGDGEPSLQRDEP